MGLGPCLPRRRVHEKNPPPPLERDQEAVPYEDDNLVVGGRTISAGVIKQNVVRAPPFVFLFFFLAISLAVELF